MKKLYWSIIISFLFCITKLEAQKLNFEHKKVGILVSRKNLQIDGYQAKYWASYLQINDTIGLSDENLKTAVTIKLGQLLTLWFQKYLNSQEIYFLNEGKQFETVVKSYPFHQKPIIKHPLDYIFCIDQLNLYSIKRKWVFAMSNKLFTEQQNKLALKGKIIIYQLEPFLMLKEENYDLDEYHIHSSPIPAMEFSYKVEKLFASWINQSLW